MTPQAFWLKDDTTAPTYHDATYYATQHVAGFSRPLPDSEGGEA